MITRKQILAKLKQRLSSDERERLQQHLFHLEQEYKLKQAQQSKKQ